MQWNSSVLFIILSYTHLDSHLCRADINSFILTTHRWAGYERRWENLPKIILASLQCSCISLTCSVSQAMLPLPHHFPGLLRKTRLKYYKAEKDWWKKTHLIKFVAWTKLSHPWVNISEAKTWMHKPTDMAGADAAASDSKQGGVERSPAN